MIERMRKILILGPRPHQEELLRHLQDAGIVQVEAYHGDAYPIDGRHVTPLGADLALSAYRTLQKYERQMRIDKVTAPTERSGLPPERIVEELPLLEDRVRILRDKIQQLSNKLDSIEPWGIFDLAMLRDICEKGDLTIQLWEVAHDYADDVSIDGAIAVMEVNVDPERHYFLTFSDHTLHFTDCLEIRYDEDHPTLARRIEALKRELAQTYETIHRMVNDRDDVFRHYLRELDKFHYGSAAWGVIRLMDDALFVLQAWCPDRSLPRLSEIAKEIPIQIEEVDPDERERVPTLMVNEGSAALGEDLVKIYDTPSYQDWDPSSWIFFSFMLFYSMIFGDAGYALTIIAALLYARHRLPNPAPGIRRFLNLSLALSGGAVVYGIITGGFYGLSSQNPLFGWVVRLALIDTDISHPGVLSKMMTISIVIGLIHITISILLKAGRAIFSLKQPIAAVPLLAWLPGIWGFYFWASLKDSDPATAAICLKIFIAAIIAVFLTSAGTWRPFKFLFGGFLGVYNGVQFFADVLSYLRLFALGLSGSLIAQNFNMLAMMVWDAGPLYFTILPAALIFVAGHALNIALCVMGGVIHGLRLNFLEWYRWSFDGGGRPFKAFRNLLADR